MAAQLVAGLQRALQIDAAPRLPSCQRRLGPRLVGNVDGELGAVSARRDARRRQADAIAADRNARVIRFQPVSRCST